MLITNHVLSGAVIGWLAPSVGSAAALGFASHFALDATPHFAAKPEHFLRVAVPDGLLGLAALGFLAVTAPPERRARVLAGMTGACLPDMDKPGRQFFGRSPYPPWFDHMHAVIQPESPRRFPVEVLAATVFGTVVTRLRRRSG